MQLYVENPNDDRRRPLRTLVCFATVAADPGEVVEARITILARAFMRFDEPSHGWVAHPGTYTIRAGRSSRDLRLVANMVI